MMLCVDSLEYKKDILQKEYTAQGAALSGFDFAGENTETAEMRAIQDAIGEIDAQIARIKELAQKNAAQRNREALSHRHDRFDSEGRAVLTTLDTLGYSELGQEDFDHLLRAMSRLHHSHGAWKDPSITPHANLTQEQQIRDLRHITESLRSQSGKSPKESFQDIRRMLAADVSFRAMWNHPDRLGAWLVQRVNIIPQDAKATDGASLKMPES